MTEAITVQAFDGVPCEVLDEARGRIAAAADCANALVESLRVRLTSAGLAQVNAEVDGRRIRVQETARGLGEALDRLAEGLRRRISAVTGTWTPRAWPQPSRPPLPPVPPAAGPQVIARVKTPSLVWCSPDAAARTLDAMDYRIHLFTDPATETDAVVYRVGPTGYRLARTIAAAPPRGCTAPLTVSPHGAPTLDDRQAAERLAGAELPFLFYADPADGRGRVLYRRFDGRLGLITGSS
ncbi:sigma 54 modulation/S30EA ribosomal C-terminal domain-containing protein [Streptomyces sp. NRRL B-24484]|uniref:sigma 54 modulation/S30EA ribosomal C-terminal domain-containing protein n=1 Tax=Streptomyces sp. NRRL B-24484 TaxID=1463833 RepID=UPI000693BC9A|nr:sigma 54 modulation/S30EA ribosomal C-terminal domain-containing protein [Streptomyces sp. NRRL B-24484]